MLKAFAIILISITLILILTFFYQKHLISEISNNNEQPFPSLDYINNIGKYCPEGYNYMGVRNNIDMCKPINVFDNYLYFTPFNSPILNSENLGLINRCKKLHDNSTWSWNSISNLCYNIE